MGIGLRNILVTGSNGQLGLSLKELSSQYGYICKFKSKKELDINNTAQIENCESGWNIKTDFTLTKISDCALTGGPSLFPQRK